MFASVSMMFSDVESNIVPSYRGQSLPIDSIFAESHQISPNLVHSQGVSFGVPHIIIVIR